jgi:predicted aspartyl protease
VRAFYQVANRKRSAAVRFIVDSGAAYSVVPAGVLEQIGVEADMTKEFFLANGIV